MKTKRTQEEIVNRIREVQDKDFFGVQVGGLIAHLDFEHAKEFLKDEISLDMWNEHTKETQTPEFCIKDYMAFAWEKANNQRGISAGRSMQHMKQWLWLDGKDELAAMCDSYTRYGKPQLTRICEEYGIDPKQYGDGEW